MLVEDRDALWRLQAGFTGAPRYFGEETALTAASIDARGFRSLPRASVAVQAQPIKILTVGDSFTFGWDVRDEDTYPTQLQALLDQQRPGAFEVVNGGMPGCTSFQAKQLLRRWIPSLRPQAVVLMLGRNDGRRAVVPDAKARVLLGWKPSISNYVFPLMYWHYRAVQYAAGRLKSELGPRVSPEEFEDNLEEIVEMLRSGGVDAIVMQHWTRGGRYQLASFAAAHHLSYVPTPALLSQEGRGRALFIEKHFHPNRDGYAVIARAVAELVLKASWSGS